MRVSVGKEVKMTKKVKTGLSKFAYPLILVCAIGLGWSHWSSSQNIQTMNSLHMTSNSLGICFERVGQSFMAIMLKDFSNNYVNNDFIQTTSECFEELKDQLENVQADWTVAIKKANYLLTDYHWLGEEIQKVASSSAPGTEVKSEEVLSFYQKVEGHKNSLMDLIEKKENSLITGSNNTLVFYASLIGLFLLALFSRKTIVQVQAKSNREKELAEQMDYIGNKKEYATQLDDSFDIEDLATPDMHQNTESLNLNLIATGVAAVLGNKAFAYGVMMDFDVSEEIYVKGQEDSINQLLYSLVIYLMEGLKKKEGDRRVKISAKTTGQRIELVVKADGLRFSKKELNYVNLRSKRVEDQMDGEIQICREIVEMSDLSLKLVNGMIDSEGYAKFIVRMRKGEPKKLFVEEPKSRKLVKLQKGSKKEIRASLQ